MKKLLFCTLSLLAGTCFILPIKVLAGDILEQSDVQMEQSQEKSLHRGPRGHRGEKGDDGDRGHRGHKGQKGDTGPAGSPGSTGPKGDTGSAGSPGSTGPIGAQGDIGPTGPSGLSILGSAEQSQTSTIWHKTFQAGDPVINEPFILDTGFPNFLAPPPNVVYNSNAFEITSGGDGNYLAQYGVTLGYDQNMIVSLGDFILQIYVRVTHQDTSYTIYGATPINDLSSTPITNPFTIDTVLYKGIVSAFGQCILQNLVEGDRIELYFYMKQTGNSHIPFLTDLNIIIHPYITGNPTLDPSAPTYGPPNSGATLTLIKLPDSPIGP